MKRSLSITIILAFLIPILIGSFLLMLPISTVAGHMKFSDAMFTATSAITVTGLIAVDTAKFFTTFGKSIILILIQIGGLGFMTFSTLTILILGKKISLTGKLIVENDFTTGNYKDIKDMIRKIVFMTLIIELLGTLFLWLEFTDLDSGERFFSSLFHSVSAFCNAGFSIFSNNFENYTSNASINITLMVLIILGGLGFLVMNEIFMKFFKRKKFTRFSLHSKLVLITSFILILAGFIIIIVEELKSGGRSLSTGERILSALFHSVSARTAGFNTLNLQYFSFASIFILLILMFIGASPGSTGGGVKTTSAGIVLSYFRSKIKGHKDINIFYRKVPQHTIEKAFIVIIISFLLISMAFLLVLTFDKGNSMSDLLFETVSAFGTVGLSLGVTTKLTILSKIVIMVTMFIGRIGPLTILLAMSRKESKAIYNYPEENIMIG